MTGCEGFECGGVELEKEVGVYGVDGEEEEEEEWGVLCEEGE